MRPEQNPFWLENLPPLPEQSKSRKKKLRKIARVMAQEWANKNCGGGADMMINTVPAGHVPLHRTKPKRARNAYKKLISKFVAEHGGKSAVVK